MGGSLANLRENSLAANTVTDVAVGCAGELDGQRRGEYAVHADAAGHFTLTIKLGLGAIAKRRHAGKIAYAKRLKKD